MNRSFSRRRSYSRFNRSRFARRSYGGTSNTVVRRARGNMRAANNQNDVSNVVINLLKPIYAGVSLGFSVTHRGEGNAYLRTDKAYDLGTAAINIYDLLRQSDFFASYAGMYDQFRISSVKVKLTPVQWSVFDQSRSISNVVTPGMKDLGPSYISSRTLGTVVWPPAQPDEADPGNAPNPVGVPSPSMYEINPDYINGTEETATNPRYIVPGIDPNIPGNYVAIPNDDIYDIAYADWDARGINYVVNVKGPGIRATGNEVNNQWRGIAGTFTDGTVTYGNEMVNGGIADGINNSSPYCYPQALTVVTAWDRTGLTPTQFVKLNDGRFIDDNTGAAYYLPAVEDKGYYFCSIGDTITTYSSSQTKQLVGGSSFNHVRYLYPSSVQEKSTYYSTDSLREQFDNTDDAPAGYTDSKYVYNPVDVNDNDANPIWTTIKPEELTNIYESPSVPFKPTLLVGILGHNDVTWNSVNNGQAADDSVVAYNMIKPVKFNLEFDIGVTFRGLRKAQVM